MQCICHIVFSVFRFSRCIVSHWLSLRHAIKSCNKLIRRNVGEFVNPLISEFGARLSFCTCKRNTRTKTRKVKSEDCERRISMLFFSLAENENFLCLVHLMAKIVLEQKVTHNHTAHTSRLPAEKFRPPPKVVCV